MKNWQDPVFITSSASDCLSANSKKYSYPEQPAFFTPILMAFISELFSNIKEK